MAKTVTREMQERAELFEQGRFMAMDVNVGKWAFVMSLAQFGSAAIKGKDFLKWASKKFGDSIEIQGPVYEDITLEAAWLAVAKRRIEVKESKIRWANPLDFKYSLSLVIGDTR